MTMNEYFNHIGKFKDKIIVISAANDCSGHIGKFHEKEHFGLQMHIGYRNSYVAVVDFKRDFVYEHADKALHDCSYQVGNRYIDIISAGFDTGNLSSIVVDGVDFSKNKRGLNIVVFHYRTLAVVDSFWVDSCEDENLVIRR